MRRGAAFLVAALLLPAGGLAHEDAAFTPAPHPDTAGHAFDAADGRFERWNFDVTCKTNAVRGSVHFVRYGTSTEWQPGASVLMRNGDEAVALYILTEHYAPPFRVALARVTLAKGAQAALAVRPFSVKVGDDGNFSFMVHWSGDGEVTATVGGETQHLGLGAPVTKVAVLGISGAGTFAPLELGSWRDTDPAKDPCAPVAQLPGGRWMMAR